MLEDGEEFLSIGKLGFLTCSIDFNNFFNILSTRCICPNMVYLKTLNCCGFSKLTTINFWRSFVFVKFWLSIEVINKISLDKKVGIGFKHLFKCE